MVDLKKRLAEYVGYEAEPYDALMDEFEPGAKSADIETLFSHVRDETVGLLAKSPIRRSSRAGIPEHSRRFCHARWRSPLVSISRRADAM